MHTEVHLCIQDWLCFMAYSPGYSTLNILSGLSTQHPLNPCGSGGLGTDRSANRSESWHRIRRYGDTITGRGSRGKGRNTEAGGGDCAFPRDAHHHQRLEAGSSVPGVSSV